MITIAYRAESVGPIVRRLAGYDDRIRVVHEDQLSSLRLIAPRMVQQPAPPDPFINAWYAARDAGTVTGLGISRVNAAQIRNAAEAFTRLYEAALIPAPVAPPHIPQQPEVLVRWGSRAEAQADVTINSAEAVALARNKRDSRRTLVGLCPQTWFRSGDIHLPCVVRPRYHHAARKFFLCNDQADVRRALGRCGPGWYASELVDKTNEYRVFVFQGRVIRISEKLSPGDGAVAWNLAAGGGSRTLKKRDWPIHIATAAIRAAGKIGLEWGAVDVGLTRDGRAVVFEANTAPGLTNDRTLEQIAWAFTSVLDNPTPQPLQLTVDVTWRELLHPSLAAQEA